MLFNSFEFLFVFLPLTWVVYTLLQARGAHRAALGVLAVASFGFYAWWDASYLPLLLGSVVVNYLLGRILAAPMSRPRLLTAGIALNLGLLVYFKYTHFLLGNLEAVVGGSWQVETIVLPLAISFFTFQQIAYLVDAHRGNGGERDFLSYCVFVTFFPQLIAGPIVHHADVLPQFRRRRPGTVVQLAGGAMLIVLGLFKKVVVADNLATWVDAPFAVADAGGQLDATLAWQGALAYTLQLYFDFSGYADMAVGLGRIFGIELPYNFNSPYKSKNIIEFWRRWHMTLSRFLRDYLYIPLGGNRLGPRRRYVNLMLTMVLGGMWHGAGWNFLIWGGLHGGYLAINHAARTIYKRSTGHSPDTPSPWLDPLSVGITMLAVIVGWVFFRATTLGGAWSMVCNLGGIPELNDLWMWGTIAVGLASVWLLPNSQTIVDRLLAPASGYRALKHPFVWGTAFACIAAAALLHLNRVSEFIYFQF